jgi:hypothetical protein
MQLQRPPKKFPQNYLNYDNYCYDHDYRPETLFISLFPLFLYSPPFTPLHYFLLHTWSSIPRSIFFMSSYAPAFYFLSVAFLISSCLLFIPSLYSLTSNISLFYSSFPVSSSFVFLFPPFPFPIFSLMSNLQIKVTSYFYIRFPVQVSLSPRGPVYSALRDINPFKFSVLFTQ